MYGTFVRHDPNHVDTRVYASTPNTRAKNVTGGVQDWSVGPIFPCAVTVVGDPHEPASVRYVALDLHDATHSFPARESYSAAETDARQYLANIERHGGRERARMIANLHRAHGAPSWSKVTGPDFNAEGAAR
jgi:hypothetical protein